MSPAEYKQLFLRDLDRLSKEINLYPSDESLWVKEKSVNNSGGNLCIHICGSLQFLIGSTIGNTGYVRNRDAEFNQTGLTKNDLIQQITDAKNMLEQVLMGLDEAKLKENYPMDFAGKGSIDMYLCIFVAHIEYHLGQISYHRRILAA